MPPGGTPEQSPDRTETQVFRIPVLPPAGPPGPYPVAAPPPAPPAPGPRRGGRGRTLGFVLLLIVGLGGMAAAAAGIAHAVLPRQFTAAQRRQIIGWEQESRWRTLPAGTIFPAKVAYKVPAADLDSAEGLGLQARRLTISPAKSCAAAFDAAAAKILARAGCSAVLRATYLDSSASMVTTVAIAVLPAGSSAVAVAGELQPSAGKPGPVIALKVPGTAASGFGDAERLVSSAAGTGPYVIMSTAGFTAGRGPDRGLRSDRYVGDEMSSLAAGVVSSARKALGQPVPAPTCPGAPGC